MMILYSELRYVFFLSVFSFFLSLYSFFCFHWYTFLVVTLNMHVFLWNMPLCFVWLYASNLYKWHAKLLLSLTLLHCLWDLSLLIYMYPLYGSHTDIGNIFSHSLNYCWLSLLKEINFGVIKSIKILTYGLYVFSLVEGIFPNPELITRVFYIIFRVFYIKHSFLYMI